MRRPAWLPFLLEPNPPGGVSQVCQENGRREGIRDIGSEQRRDQSKGGLSNYVTDTTVRVSVRLCVLSVLQSQSGTAA